MSGFACFLPSEAMIHLRGSKIPDFLQGQLTCDTRKLSHSNAVLGALCNVKGRVLSDLLAIQLSDSHLVLRLRRSLASSVVETLRRYAQFSRISVDLDPREDAIVGIRQPGETQSQEQRSGDSISTSLGHGLVSIQRGSSYGEVLSIDPQNPIDLADRVAGETLDVESRWAMETLLSGHYALELDDLELFTPQALNYDLTGLVAFDKGCYTGQEIVARLHYKGQSKRRLQILKMPDSIDLNSVTRDAPLRTMDGKTVGRCLRTESAAGAATLLAAEVQIDHLNQDLFLAAQEPLKPLGLQD